MFQGLGHARATFVHVTVQQFCEQGARALEFIYDHGHKRFALCAVFDQAGIGVHQFEVGGRQIRFDVGQQVAKEHRLWERGFKRGEALGVVAFQLCQCAADSEPTRQVKAGPWVHENTQGMARRSPMEKSFLPVRRAGREPMRAFSSASMGVACR